MATKAEEFRAQAERSGKKKKAPKVRKPKPVKPHNLSVRAKKKATYEYEETPPGKRPPRKSTRLGKNRVKHEAPQHIAAINKSRSPETRATRLVPTAGGKAKRGAK
jgi:hypothetical protein